MTDRYGHVIFDGEEYLKGKHLKSIRSKDIRFKKYELMKDDVLIGPDEVFEIYIDPDSALNLARDCFKCLLTKVN